MDSASLDVEQKPILNVPIWSLPKIGLPKKSSILVGGSTVNHPFWQETPNLTIEIVVADCLGGRGTSTIFSNHILPSLLGYRYNGIT